MKNILFTSLVLFLVSSFTSAQQNLKGLRKLADKRLEEGNVAEALGSYKILIFESEDKDIEVNWKGARGFHQYRAYDLAEKAYRNVIQHPDSSVYPSRYYYLGQVLKQKGPI